MCTLQSPFQGRYIVGDVGGTSYSGVLWTYITVADTSAHTIRLIYLAAAGHVLGLALKPPAQVDLEADFQRALDYVRAKQLSVEWTDINRVALDKFRRFLRHERGQLEIKVHPFDAAAHARGLPAWVVRELERFQHLRQRNWRPARLEEGIRRFWCGQCGVRELKELKRTHLYRYVEQRTQAGRAVTGIIGDLRELRSFLLFLQDQGASLPESLLRMPRLKPPDRLPKYLTDEQVKKLRDAFEQPVAQAASPAQRRDALLDRATFYLLWQGGLRRGEVEELRLEDLDLPGRKLTVRQGKGLKDRTVFLTGTVVQALETYLAMRGMGPSDHVFLYRNQPLSKDLIHGRLKAVGAWLGVKVHAHRLRHTCATQLLNAGCRITSIQAFLGHKKLNSTLTSARVYDQTVADDYYSAMRSVEKRLELIGAPEPVDPPLTEDERGNLLILAEWLAVPRLEDETRLEIAERMRQVLTGQVAAAVSVVESMEAQLNIPPPKNAILVSEAV